jgi:hypothetical protein
MAQDVTDDAADRLPDGRQARTGQLDLAPVVPGSRQDADGLDDASR